MRDLAWLGRKPDCQCPVFAALKTERRRNAPVVPLGSWTKGGKAMRDRTTGKWKRHPGQWRDGEGTLKMSVVPLDQANVVVCQCAP